MDKLQMAHDWAMKRLNDPDYVVSMGQFAADAWRYADAMQAELDSRMKKDRPTVLQEEFQPTGYETPTDEWQPDWSQAPSSALTWSIGFDGMAQWALYDNGVYVETIDAPSFNYQGSWKDSLRERP